MLNFAAGSSIVYGMAIVNRKETTNKILYYKVRYIYRYHSIRRTYNE